MTRYRFDSVDFEYEGANKVNAQKIGEELSGINDLTPKKVVDFARANPKSEVAKFIEWRDETAASQFRFDQARKLIERLTIVVESRGVVGEPVQVKVHAYKSTIEGGFEKYVPVKITSKDLNRPSRDRSHLLPTGSNSDVVLHQMIQGLNELRTLWMRHHDVLELDGEIDAHLNAAKATIEAKLEELGRQDQESV